VVTRAGQAAPFASGHFRLRRRDGRPGLERRPARPLQQILFETADGITPELAAIGLLAAAVGLAPQVRH